MWHDLWEDGILELYPPDGFYAYVIAFSSATAQMIALGSLNSFGIFFPFLREEFHMGLGQLAFIVSLANLLSPLMGPFAGGIADRYGTRWIICIGAVCICIAYLGTSYVTQPWQMYLSYGLTAGLASGCVLSPGLAVVGQWFNKRRAVGMGISLAGAGLGSVVIPIMSSFLLDYYQNDWRKTFRTLSALAGVMFLISTLIKQRLYILKSIQDESISRLDILKTGSFWRLFAIGLFFSYSFFIPIVHIVQFTEFHNMGVKFSGYTLSMMGATQMFGNVVCGYLADKLSHLLIFKLSHAGAGISMCLWPLCTTRASILTFAAFMGLFTGGCTTCYPALASLTFPAEKLVVGISMMYFGFGIGSLSGPVLTGILVDAVGTYTPGAILGGCAMFCSLAISMTFKPGTPPSLARCNSRSVLEWDDDVMGSNDSEDEISPFFYTTARRSVRSYGTASSPSQGSDRTEHSNVGSLDAQ